MEELRRQGQQRCKERRAFLGYASLDSDSEDSIKRLTRVLGPSYVFGVMVICAEILDILFAQVTVATASSCPLLGITAAALSLFSLVWQGIY